MSSGTRIERSPYGEYFSANLGEYRALFFHGGWGKVAASASTQYVIDQFRPEYFINLWTCGGIGNSNGFETV